MAVSGRGCPTVSFLRKRSIHRDFAVTTFTICTHYSATGAWGYGLSASLYSYSNDIVFIQCIIEVMINIIMALSFFTKAGQILVSLSSLCSTLSVELRLI